MQKHMTIPVNYIDSQDKPSFAKKTEQFFVSQRSGFVWLHWSVLILFLAITVIPLYLPIPDAQDSIFSHFTLFANFLIWGLWFPFALFSVVVSGRSWCGVLCPMGAASQWINSVGLKRAIPIWLRWEGTPTVSFIVVTVWGQTVGVRDYPEAIAYVFGTTFLLALLIGFLYGRNKRAWCRHMCPIGSLLGLYARLGAVQFSPKRPKDGDNDWTEKTLCPTMLDINRKRSARHCIQCFDCVRPESKGGLAFAFRKPGLEIEKILENQPRLSEVLFIFTGAGIVFGGFIWLSWSGFNHWRQAIGTWFIEREMFWIGESGPAFLMSVHPEQREVFNWLDFMTISGFMILVMVCITGLLTLSTTVTASLYSTKKFTFNQRFIAFGYAYAPTAMISLIVGLGHEALHGLDVLIGDTGVDVVSAGLIAFSVLWSFYLASRIARQFASDHWKIQTYNLPVYLSCLLLGAGWWYAIL